MIKPNFFIIGAPKCGTTALCCYLQNHPNIFLSKQKEIWYFSRDFRTGNDMNLNEYLSHFSKADPKIHKAIGEATTAYLASKLAVDEILKFNSESKFIVMLRNPVEMIQSYHSQCIVNGVEDIIDFEVAWKAESDRLLGKRIPFNLLDVKSVIYSEWAKFGDQMERLFSSAPRKNIHVIIFDDFIANTKSEYEKVLKFLNVESNNRTSFTRINENKNVKWIWIHKYLMSTFSKLYIIKNKLGISKNLGLLNKITSLNIKPGNRKSISDEFKGELKSFYKEDVMKLSKLLERDLKHWV